MTTFKDWLWIVKEIDIDELYVDSDPQKRVKMYNEYLNSEYYNGEKGE